MIWESQLPMICSAARYCKVRVLQQFQTTQRYLVCSKIDICGFRRVIFVALSTQLKLVSLYINIYALWASISIWPPRKQIYSKAWTRLPTNRNGRLNWSSRPSVNIHYIFMTVMYRSLSISFIVKMADDGIHSTESITVWQCKRSSLLAFNMQFVYGRHDSKVVLRRFLNIFEAIILI